MAAVGCMVGMALMLLVIPFELVIDVRTLIWFSVGAVAMGLFGAYVWRRNDRATS